MQLYCILAHNICISIKNKMTYFFKTTTNGIIVTSSKITNKLHFWGGPEVINQLDHPIGVDMGGYNEEELMEWIMMPEIKFGFVALENPKELGLKFGDELPFTISSVKCKQGYFPGFKNICWAD